MKQKLHEYNLHVKRQLAVAFLSNVDSNCYESLSLNNERCKLKARIEGLMRKILDFVFKLINSRIFKIKLPCNFFFSCHQHRTGTGEPP